MSGLIKSYPNWLDEETLRNFWGGTVCQGNWRFGQKSNDDTVYPMWFQHYYDCKPGLGSAYREEATPECRTVGDRFMELIGPEYTLIRNMVAGNTFGQDGDIHQDWDVPGVSLTGVVYLNRRWEDNWGGETVLYNKDHTEIEISKFEAGKLIVFDGYNPHIGKGPQRACGELRCIIALQAVLTDVWQEFVDSATKNQ